MNMHALRNFFIINRRLLPIKFHFGLFNAGISTVQPTMPVYAKVLHFSTYMVGTIYTILPIFALVLKPAFCSLADKFKWHRGVLITWEIILLVSYFAIQFIPPDDTFSPAKTQGLDFYNASACISTNSTPYFFLETKDCSWTCPPTKNWCSAWNMTDNCLQYGVEPQQKFLFDNCISLPFNDDLKKDCPQQCSAKNISQDGSYEQADSESFKQWQFYIFVLCMLGAWCGTSIINTISDTVCIEICDDASIYGKQRHWGTLAWGVIVVINGFIIDAVSTEGEEKNYTPAFYIMLAPLVIDIVLFYFIKFEIPQRSQNIATDVWQVCLKPRTIVLLIWCVMVGISLAALWNFLFLLLEDLATELNDPSVSNNIKTIEGLVSGAQCFIGESPSFFFGGMIVDKIGHGHALSLVLGLVGFRYIFYSLLVNPWWCIPIEFLQSYFGLFYSTITSYAKQIATPGTEATIQSILAAVAEGIGVAIGSYVIGVMYTEYGGSETFQILGISFVVMGVINEGIEYIFKILERRNPIQEKEEISETVAEITAS